MAEDVVEPAERLPDIDEAHRVQLTLVNPSARPSAARRRPGDDRSMPTKPDPGRVSAREMRLPPLAQPTR